VTDKHLFAQMTWPEVNEAVRQRRVVVLPIAAIEQHGPHLPVDTDNVLASTICETAASRAADAMVAMPAIHYGFNDHNMEFPGTISVKMQHFVDYCFDVAASLAYQGFRRIVLVNAHGSNSPLCDLIARRVTIETPALCASINHWQLAWGEIAAQLEGGPHAADHACEWETSEYLHLRPELVRMDLAADEIAAERGGPRWLYPSVHHESPVKFMNWWSRMSATGVNGTPTLATAEKGRVMVETTISRLIEVCRDFRDLPDGRREDHRLPEARMGSEDD
jgi:creatinine amidohydrolase